MRTAKAGPSTASTNGLLARSGGRLCFVQRIACQHRQVIGIDEKTLRKHYAGELDVAAIKANAAVGRTAFLMATGGPRRLWRQAVPSMTIFWLKTRMGWKETAQVQHTGAVGSYDYSKLSDDDLARLDAILALAEVSPGDGDY